MGTSQEITALPAAECFVSELLRRVDDGYPDAIRTIAKAIAAAGGDGSQVVQFARSPLSKAAFTLGCCAEELAALGPRLGTEEGRAFVRDILGELRPHVRPLTIRRLSPDFRRLLAKFRDKPTRMRLRTVQYMLEADGLSALAHLLSDDAVAELTIECTVMIDGVTGVLAESMVAARAGRTIQCRPTDRAVAEVP